MKNYKQFTVTYPEFYNPRVAIFEDRLEVFQAASEGKVSLLLEAVNMRADFYATAQCGSDRLVDVCSAFGDLEAVKLLVKCGAKPMYRRVYCDPTSLELAAAHGQTHVVKFLLENVVNVNGNPIDDAEKFAKEGLNNQIRKSGHDQYDYSQYFPTLDDFEGCRKVFHSWNQSYEMIAQERSLKKLKEKYDATEQSKKGNAKQFGENRCDDEKQDTAKQSDEKRRDDDSAINQNGWNLPFPFRFF
ncbi:MAG: ankyrin repeat domain-containing protein [Proteobacteria bacterium]|nr:ankyrin repeat domain-containing protein [Pseudomonadota bacterium]